MLSSGPGIPFQKNSSPRFVRRRACRLKAAPAPPMSTERAPSDQPIQNRGRRSAKLWLRPAIRATMPTAVMPVTAVAMMAPIAPVTPVVAVAAIAPVTAVATMSPIPPITPAMPAPMPHPRDASAMGCVRRAARARQRRCRRSRGRRCGKPSENHCRSQRQHRNPSQTHRLLQPADVVRRHLVLSPTQLQRKDRVKPRQPGGRSNFS